MRKPPARLTRSSSIPLHVFRGFLSALIWIVLGYLGWLYTEHVHLSREIGIFDYLGLVGLAVILPVPIQRSLSAFTIDNVWSYRLGFLGASLMLGGLGIYASVNRAMSPDILWLFLAAAGAFLGCLLLTGTQQSLWENNSPPPAHTRQEVERLHRVMIGPLPPTPRAKRLFDFSLALVGLVISAPVWLLSAVLIWLEDPGPLLFIKNSVGKGGINFHQFKFRTMMQGAEDVTGPVLASEDDQRVLSIGRLLRKTALDELPQLLNILRGQMSFVGPRPQRTILVQGYLKVMPEYAERHKVLPGLAGLAQVAGDYYLTPRQKLRFDRLYIRHSSLGFDLKLILLAFLITFWYRWQKDWDGRVPRKLLRWGSSVGSQTRSIARAAPAGNPNPP